MGGYKSFTVEEDEAGLALIIHAVRNRDNFTDLRQLWCPI